MPASTLPTSHWNVRRIGQTTLLNPQNGVQAHVQVTPLAAKK
jgi:hypothetical protein